MTKNNSEDQDATSVEDFIDKIIKNGLVMHKKIDGDNMSIAISPVGSTGVVLLLARISTRWIDDEDSEDLFLDCIQRLAKKYFERRLGPKFRVTHMRAH